MLLGVIKTKRQIAKIAKIRAKIRGREVTLVKNLRYKEFVYGKQPLLKLIRLKVIEF